MKDPYELIRTKEDEIKRLRTEIESLRITAHLLGEEGAVDPPFNFNMRQVIPMP